MVTVFVVGLPLKIYSLSTSKSMPQRETIPGVLISTVPLKRLPWNDRNKSGSSHSWFRKLKLIYKKNLRLETTFTFVEQPTPSRTFLQTFSILKELKINKCFKWCCMICTFMINHSMNDKNYFSVINNFVKRILIFNKIAGVW